MSRLVSEDETQPEISQDEKIHKKDALKSASSQSGIASIKGRQESKTKKQLSESMFFQVMDSVEELDHLLKDINDLYSQGMLGIASVKFANPFTSLNINGYKSTPATKKTIINPQSKQIDIVRHSRNSPLKFEYQSISKKCQDPENFQEEELLEEEAKIENQCSDKISSLSEEDFILDRFSIDSQRPMVLESKNNFEKLLEKVFEMHKLKLKLNRRFKGLQDSGQKQNTSVNEKI